MTVQANVFFWAPPCCWHHAHLCQRRRSPPPPSRRRCVKAPPPRKVQLLFVQNADRIVMKDRHTIILEGVSPATIFFSDRPDRITGHMPTSQFISRWNSGKDSFAADPPNATLAVLDKQNRMRDFVVELRNPRLKGNALTYDVKLLQGKVLAKSGGPCTLFIDALSESFGSESYGPDGRSYVRGDDGIVVDDDPDNARVWNDNEDTDHVWKEKDTDHVWKDGDTDHVWKEND